MQVISQVVELLKVHVGTGQKERDRTTYPGIPDARTVQEAQEVQERQPRDEAPVYPSDKLGLVDTRHVHVGIVDGTLVLASILHRFGIWQLFVVGGGHVAAVGGEGEQKRWRKPPIGISLNNRSAQFEFGVLFERDPTFKCVMVHEVHGRNIHPKRFFFFFS